MARQKQPDPRDLQLNALVEQVVQATQSLSLPRLTLSILDQVIAVAVTHHGEDVVKALRFASDAIRQLPASLLPSLAMPREAGVDISQTNNADWLVLLHAMDDCEDTKEQIRRLAYLVDQLIPQSNTIAHEHLCMVVPTLPGFAEHVEHMWRSDVLHTLHMARSTRNACVRKAAAQESSPQASGDASSARETTKGKPKRVPAPQRTFACSRFTEKTANERLMSYAIAGVSLANLTGKQVRDMLIQERNKSRTHLFHALVLEAVAARVSEDQIVQDMLTERDLERIWKQAHAASNQQDTDAA